MKIRNFLLFVLIIILGYFFINHQNDEDIINEKYQRALNLWDEGKEKKALNILNEILIKYKNTDLTKLIYLKKLDYEKIYFAKFNPHHVKKDIFSAVMQRKINDYFNKFLKYPEELNSLILDSRLQDYVNLCEYEKYGKKGFYINCQKIEDEYNKTINKTIENIIPLNSFFTYYSNNATLNDSVYSEITNDISINLNGKFSKIDSNLINAYWIGYIKVQQDEKRTIFISQNSSKTKVTIDNKIFFNNSGSKSFTISLKKGLHKVQVEFNTHVTYANLMISFNEHKKHQIYGKNLIKFFDKVKHIDYEPVIVSINQSNNRNNKIDLHLKKFSKPIVLFLSSYESVKWNILNQYNNKIFAIINSSYYNNSIIENTKDTLIVKSNIRFPPRIKQKSSCVGSSFNITGSNIFEQQKRIYKLTSKNLTNYTGDYIGSEYIIPMFTVDKKFITETNENINYIKSELEKCKHKFKLNNSNGKLFILKN